MIRAKELFYLGLVLCCGALVYIAVHVHQIRNKDLLEALVSPPVQKDYAIKTTILDELERRR